ncbi:MAG: methionine aminotransferase [Flavobacteriales bacterium]
MERQEIPSTPSIFSVMSQLANEYGAINLAQGFPNFPIDQALRDAVSHAAQGPAHQYAPYQGQPALRSAIKALIEKNNGAPITTDEILITAGATQAIFTTVQALVSRGDEVVLLDPCYDCYETPVSLVGARPVHVELGPDFLPDWDVINSAVTPKTTLMIINSPHNPSGRVWTADDFSHLISLVSKFPKLTILSDEVYEYLTYSTAHISVRGYESLKARSVVVSSFGKTLQVTGWKMGYLCAPAHLMQRILNVHQYLVFSVNSVMQDAISKYLPTFNAALIRTEYEERMTYFRKGLSASRFTCLPCEGTYFQTVDYSQISNQNDVDFCLWLIKEHGVAAIPLSVFYNSKKDLHHIRLCFAKDQATLTNALEKLCKI